MKKLCRIVTLIQWDGVWQVCACCIHGAGDDGSWPSICMCPIESSLLNLGAGNKVPHCQYLCVYNEWVHAYTALHFRLTVISLF